MRGARVYYIAPSPPFLFSSDNPSCASVTSLVSSPRVASSLSLWRLTLLTHSPLHPTADIPTFLRFVVDAQAKAAPPAMSDPWEEVQDHATGQSYW